MIIISNVNKKYILENIKEMSCYIEGVENIFSKLKSDACSIQRNMSLKDFESMQISISTLRKSIDKAVSNLDAKYYSPVKQRDR